MTRENFQVDLRGIVQILSHHLYSSPRVYLRELIQNARDAIHARSLAEADAPREIEIRTDDARGELVVSDSGIGLTADEMRTLLATIGASSKRNEFEAARADFLGQFGIGLLSCFLIGEEIEVISRSAKEPDAVTMRWVGRSNGTYTVAAADEPLDLPGTRVRVVARPDDRDWVTHSRVRLLAARFASLLDLPIRLRRAGDEGPGELVSQHPAPWNGDAEQAGFWCEDEFGFAPDAMLPVSVPVAGVRGVAFIGPDPERIGSRRGDIVFCRGMFVAADNTQLAPPWANFVRLGIECGDLSPTASRESLQDSALLERVRDEIGDQIQRGVERLAVEDPDAFAQLVDVHGDGMRAMAVTDDAMLDFVVAHLYWETSAGPMTLEEIGRSGLPLGYVTRTGDFTAYAPLAKASGQLLVNGGYAYGREILERVRGRWSTRRVYLSRFRIESVLEGLSRPAAADKVLAEDVRSAVSRRLRDEGLEADVRSFQPPTLPVVLVPGGPATEVPAAGADPWGDLLGALGEPSAPEPRGPRLILNLSSPAVRALGETADPGRLDAAVDVLRVLGLLLAGESLRDADTTRLTGAIAALIRTPEETR